MDITQGNLSSDIVRRNWRDVVDYVSKGNHVVVSRASKPVVAIIPIEDFTALVQQLEDFHDVRMIEQQIADYIANRHNDPDPAMERLLQLRAEAEADRLAGTAEPVLATV